MRNIVLLAVSQMLGATLSLGAVAVKLSPLSSISQPIGTSVTWSATNMNGDDVSVQYRWVISQNGIDVVVRDFDTTSTIRYAPMEEGPYSVTVTGRNQADVTDVSTVSTTYTATSLLGTSNVPTVTATENPLVAIYSAACTAGSMRVFFAPLGTMVAGGTATPSKPCVAGKSVNFVIAGMRPSTIYSLTHQIRSGYSFERGPQVQFQTGSIPSSLTLPAMTVSGISRTESVILNSYISPNIIPVAYDTSGQVIWYNTLTAPGTIDLLMRPLNGGTMMMAQADYLQEVDLLGNVIRETNITRMSEQLSSSPFHIIDNAIPNRLADFDHEAIRLPDGNTAVIALVEQIADQGDGPTDVLGDLILVLDRNFQLVWAWNSFDHLDVRRKATLNDVCAAGLGCPALKYVPAGQGAKDWLHANALALTGDGNLLLSLRSQDWVIKIQYANGAGDGSVLWRLGNQGDFALDSGLWFSHQHNPTLNGRLLTLFDNANGDHQAFGGSRGLLFSLDEAGKTASIVTEARMGNYSLAVGSAQTLLNGNLFFLCGMLGSNSQAIEFSPDQGQASPLAFFDMLGQAYRSFRMKDLYTP